MPYSDNDDTRIKGGTDETMVGNIGDSLKINVTNFPAVQVVSETELKTFIAYANGVSIGKLKSMVSIVNTSGSTVTIKIREIYLINTKTSAVTGVIADFRLLRITGHSAGSLLDVSAHDTMDTLDTSVSVRTGAAVTSELAPFYKRWVWSTDEHGTGSLDQEGYDHGIQTSVPAYSSSSSLKTKPLTLNANEGFTIKQLTNSNNGTFDLSILFTQE